MADATSITERNYVRDDVETFLHNLLMAANFNAPSAERELVFIAITNKCAKQSESGNITCNPSDVVAQPALLKILEESTVKEWY